MLASAQRNLRQCSSTEPYGQQKQRHGPSDQGILHAVCVWACVCGCTLVCTSLVACDSIKCCARVCVCARTCKLCRRGERGDRVGSIRWAEDSLSSVMLPGSCHQAPYAEALAVSVDGRIARVGSLADLQLFATPASTLVDLQGRWLMPVRKLLLVDA